MSRSRQVLGVGHIALGGAGLLYGVLGAGFSVVLGALWGLAGLRPGAPQGAEYIVGTFGGLGVLILAVYLLTCLPLIIGGLGLVTGRRWGRTVALATSTVLLIGFPIGTVLGLLGMLVLRFDAHDDGPRPGASGT